MNEAEGEAEAILAVARTTAEGVRQVAGAINTTLSPSKGRIPAKAVEHVE